MDNNKNQLSLFDKDLKTTLKKIPGEDEIKTTVPYGFSICNKCLCNRCVHNCECSPGKITKEEKENNETCWNCDDCYFYGGDIKLSQHVVKFECDNYKSLKYYIELDANRMRKNFKII